MMYAAFIFHGILLICTVCVSISTKVIPYLHTPKALLVSRQIPYQHLNKPPIAFDKAKSVVVEFSPRRLITIASSTVIAAIVRASPSSPTLY
jgi:hypothetical protein